MKKRILAVLLVVLLFTGTAVAFGYWDNLSQSETDITIGVGEGVTLSVTAQDGVPSGNVLVPAGALMKTNDVDEIVLTYNVKLDKAVVTAPTLTVTSSNVKINGSTTYSSLVDIDIVLGSSTVNDSDVLVTVTVTLLEPGDVTAYNAVINHNITFDLTFSAA